MGSKVLVLCESDDELRAFSVDKADSSWLGTIVLTSFNTATSKGDLVSVGMSPGGNRKNIDNLYSHCSSIVGSHHENYKAAVII